MPKQWAGVDAHPCDIKTSAWEAKVPCQNVWNGVLAPLPMSCQFTSWEAADDGSGPWIPATYVASHMGFEDPGFCLAQFKLLQAFGDLTSRCIFLFFFPVLLCLSSK